MKREKPYAALARLAIAVSLALAGTLASAHTITLTATVRDFTPAHPDFESGIPGLVTGLVESTIGADRTPVLKSPRSPDAGAIFDATSFAAWFHDTPGVNIAIPVPITLDNGLGATTGGTYVFSSGAFFPIDGMGFGDYAFGHNYHFTLELHGVFTYVAGQTFAFTGDDDVWAFIGDELVVDLGGVHGAASGSVALDTLGLTAGDTYAFDFFFAERHTSASSFAMTTSIELRSPPPTGDVPAPGVLALLGIGLAGFGMTRRVSRA